jgi:hypothetical protein
MLVTELVDQLGYSESPHYLSKGTRQFATSTYVGHIFRSAARPATAERPSCSLLGVYVLQDSPDDNDLPRIPLVYVCHAKTEAESDEIHRLVWNQDAVPFLIVHTPKGIKFYSGFEYTKQGNGALSNLVAFNQAKELIREFHRNEIDSGRLWNAWTDKVQPQHRVNWKLLQNLKRLDHVLQNQSGLAKEVSHGLIGKYVYLHYLRDRGILSDRKLESWNLDSQQVFGQSASLTKFKQVVRKLDECLNGSIFPIPLSGPNAPSASHIKLVAGVFSGDDVLDSGDRQLSLDFQAYDFSFIPIETLSVVYEQFLHEQEQDGTTRGREEGAYYTPIPVVNFMLAEMEERQPLDEGVTVFDPACGSGAFLVQCYRRLIERKYPQHRHTSVHPIELRRLLVDHIYGLDRDADACSVTELSLTLTLLDYVDPPDLENDKRVKLPALRGTNVFHTDFFLDRPAGLAGKQFDWVIGNPPWKKLNPRKLREEDRPAWDWMNDNEREMPVGGNQLARAFAWGVASKGYLKKSGHVGLFMPAMTLFDKQATTFRKKFFHAMNVRTIANFANLAEVIADGRFRVPSASFIYSASAESAPSDFIRAYSPLVANQEATKPHGRGSRKESWCIVINDAEIHDVPWKDIRNGDGLPWKLAAWGSHFDKRLLEKLSRRFPSIGKLQKTGLITVSQGPDLRDRLVKEGENKTEFQEELVGKKQLDTEKLARLRHLFSFPTNSLIPCENHYLRLRAGRRTLRVCPPPHVIVSAARYFAVYSDEFLVVPSRQIGIVSESDDRDLLRALSLFLSSEFAFYHQFFSSTEFGVKRDRATVDALLQMPMPLSELGKRELQPWTQLHAKLIETTPCKLGERQEQSRPLLPDDVNLLEPLLAELNEMVFESLGLNDRERALIYDLVQVRLELNDGKVGEPATGKPQAPTMRTYARRLKNELDAFLGPSADERHKIDVVFDNHSGMICIDLVKDRNAARTPTVEAADKATSKQLLQTRNNLRDEAGQWVYFDRDLRILNGTKTFLFKPMQRFHWTESQAMIDASEIIAETTSGVGE